MKNALDVIYFSASVLFSDWFKYAFCLSLAGTVDAVNCLLDAISKPYSKNTRD